MKKKLTLLGCTALLLAAAPKANAQAFLETFNSGIPATWLRYNVDGLTPNAGVSFMTNAWVNRLRSAGDSCICSTSWYEPVGTANDWIVSPSFTVTSTNMWLHWEEFTPDASFPDGYEVKISTTGNTPADFTTNLMVVTAANTNGFLEKGANLGAYNGMTVRVAFRNNSNDKYLLYLDNIGAMDLPSNDLSLVTVSPDPTATTSYNTTGSNATVTGTVQNLGYSTVTSYTVYYQDGISAPVSYTASASIAPFGFANFTHSTPFTIPSTGLHDLKTWVVLGGDVNNVNDTAHAGVTGVSFFPPKKILIEEGTGTWCGWCVRGIVYMDSIQAAHPDNFSLVAVHNGDPMTVSAYDSYITALPGFTGFPGIAVDRREILDPSDLFAIYSNEHTYFGFASVDLGTGTLAGTTYTLPVTVTPALDLSGDYRLALVLTEDDVHSTSAAWDQHNYYSGGGSGAMQNSEYNFATLGSTINNVNFDFVARSVSSTIGDAGTLPATMTAGTPYTYTYTATINPSWNSYRMHAVVMLLRVSDGVVLNSNNTGSGLAIGSVAANIKGMSVFPNPASEATKVSINLTETTDVTISVLDAMGRVVYNYSNGRTAAGENFFTIPTSNLATGVYNVKVQTSTGSLTQKLNVLN
jgi:hypothetical protein